MEDEEILKQETLCGNNIRFACSTSMVVVAVLTQLKCCKGDEGLRLRKSGAVAVRSGYNISCKVEEVSG